ncbi:MAG: hypothetical protein ACMXYF_03040 [Candidatus Woesearchaeota archaeon]
MDYEQFCVFLSRFNEHEFHLSFASTDSHIKTVLQNGPYYDEEGKDCFFTKALDFQTYLQSLMGSSQFRIWSISVQELSTSRNRGDPADVLQTRVVLSYSGVYEFEQKMKNHGGEFIITSKTDAKQLFNLL